MDLLSLVGREREILTSDLEAHDYEITRKIESASFLVIGGAGSIGQAVVKEIFARNPKRLYVIDISENNLVELVRDIRSSIGYIDGDFQTFAIDAGSEHFFALLKSSKPFDFVLNLSAMKHVRSEKDPYSLMRLLDVNLLNVISCVDFLTKQGSTKYFSVSTDKAANPANLMGASKYLMERYLLSQSDKLKFSSARFANVAFSDGSLLFGFEQRILKQQPLSAPLDIRRYFITPSEAGKICLFSCILGENRDIFFPKLTRKLHEITFAEIAVNYLQAKNKNPVICQSEQEARDYLTQCQSLNNWPCYFFKSDTTGEKEFEEFYTENEKVDLTSYEDLGIVKNISANMDQSIYSFLEKLAALKASEDYDRSKLVTMFREAIHHLDHKETGKFLDGRM